MAGDKDLSGLLNDQSWTQRRRLRPVAVVVMAASIAVLVYFAFLGGGEEGPSLVAEPATATRGQLVTTLTTTGTVEASSSGEVAFLTAGEVATIDVVVGQAVNAGQFLATLVNEGALRDLERAQIQVEIAELRLLELLEPSPEDVAAAEQAVGSAQSQVNDAEQSLAWTVAGPSSTTIAQAKQATADARSQLGRALNELELLLDPTSADVESAAQSAASAEAQLAAAQRSLDALLEPPGPEDFARADQSVASTRAQVAQAEDGVRRLIDGPTEQEIAAAAANLIQAQNSVANATTSLRAAEANVPIAWANLLAAQDSYCDFTYTTSINVCSASDVPLSSSDIQALTDSIARPTNPGSTQSSRTTSLLQSNASYLSALDNVASAQGSLAAAEASLVTSEAASAALASPATASEMAQADESLRAAEAALTIALADRAALDEPVSEAQIREAELSVASARSAWAAALDRQATLLNPTALQVQLARDAIAAAELSLETTEQTERWTLAGPSEFDLVQAELSTEGARDGLAAAESRLSELTTGDSMAIILQRYDLRLAELSLVEAEDRVNGLRVVSPRDGVVGAINVRPGNTVGADQVGFVVSDPAAVQISLTVSEADFPGLAPGQLGLATFEALGETQYVVRLVSVGTVPNVAQGVVTYPVVAELLGPAELAGQGPDLAALLGSAAPLGAAGGAPGLGAGPGGEGPGSGFGARGAGGGPGGGGAGGLQLPEGMTIAEFREAVRAGELPDGFELPDGVDLETLQERFAGGGFGGGGNAPAGGGLAQTGALAQALSDAPPPVVGMSASVTLLLEVRVDVLLVPSNAIRSEGQTRYVVVEITPGESERRTVTTGDTSDGNTEILAGLEEGETILIGGLAPAPAATAVDTAGFGAGGGGRGAPGGGAPGGGFGGGGGGPGGGG